MIISFGSGSPLNPLQIGTFYCVWQIVYCREGVAVWPTKSERITGRLSLINQHCVVFLAWLPYSHGLLNADGSFEAPAEPQQLSNVARGELTTLWRNILLSLFALPSQSSTSERSHLRSAGNVATCMHVIQNLKLKQVTALVCCQGAHALLMQKHCPCSDARPCSAADRTMYAVHPVPLSDIKAIRKHAPSFGWQYIIVVLTNGLTLPPLYFSAGGVRGLISALKQVRTGQRTMYAFLSFLLLCTSKAHARS